MIDSIKNLLKRNLNNPIIRSVYGHGRKHFTEAPFFIRLIGKWRVLKSIAKNFPRRDSFALSQFETVSLLERKANSVVPENAPPVAIFLLAGLEKSRRIEKCLNSIVTNTIYPAYDLFIVAPGGSARLEKSMKKSGKPVKFVEIEDPTATSEKIDRLVSRSTHPYLIFLDCNAVPVRGWLNELVHTLRTVQDSAAACPKLVARTKSFFGRYPEKNAYTVLGEEIRFVAEKGKIRMELHTEKTDPLSDSSPRLVPAMHTVCQAWNRNAFVKLKAFDEKLSFELGAVDLCLKAAENGFKNVYTPSSALAIEKPDRIFAGPSRKNRKEDPNDGILFEQKWNNEISKRIAHEKLSGAKPFWAQRPLTIGMIVTEKHPDTVCGDYFTALGLGRELEKEGHQVVYFSERPVYEWLSPTSKIDVLLVFRHTYDPTPLKRFPGVVTIAWVRGYADKWRKMPWFKNYDGVIASSQKALDSVAAYTDPKKCLGVLMLAADTDLFAPGPERSHLKTDISFVGNLFEVEREFAKNFELPHGAEFRFYGKLENPKHPMSKYHCGVVPHRKVAEIYNSSKIVIEDCTPMCKPWGCINSRTFEAMATGACVVSNQTPGLEELFGNSIVVYKNDLDFKKKIQWLLQDEISRKKIGHSAMLKIRRNHTYKHRCAEFKRLLLEFYTRG